MGRILAAKRGVFWSKVLVNVRFMTDGAQIITTLAGMAVSRGR
jgi:hypothetical protein